MKISLFRWFSFLKKPKLQSKLLRRLFVSASIRRWNDQACPLEFVELDKQAHKAMIMYLLAKDLIDRGKNLDLDILIKYFCFEFFERLVLTDIKPPIFYALQQTHHKELASYVAQSLQDEISSYFSLQELEDYLSHKPKNLETQILESAHFYASKWEFDIIYHFNPNMYGVKEIKEKIDKQLKNNEHLFEGLFGEKEDLKKMVSMFGQLRFQKRWSQTPRVPQTSVLGHTLCVAIMGYLLSFDLKTCKNMRINHFLGGLFHDLPEILTRDIITPIKRSVVGLDDCIKDIEKEEMQNKVYSFVSLGVQEDLKYFTENEFKNRYKDKSNQIVFTKDANELFALYNQDEYQGVCGELLKVCDHLSAFLEAKISLSHGISSTDLIKGAENLFKLRSHTQLLDLDLGALFRDFK
nr:HD domain-containing protein [Helicobacter cetorum]